MPEAGRGVSAASRAIHDRASGCPLSSAAMFEELRDPSETRACIVSVGYVVGDPRWRDEDLQRRVESRLMEMLSGRAADNGLAAETSRSADRLIAEMTFESGKLSPDFNAIGVANLVCGFVRDALVEEGIPLGTGYPDAVRVRPVPVD